MLAAAAVLSAVLGIHESTLAPLNAGPMVRGFTRGVDAVGFDPAASAVEDGLAVQYRHRIVQGDDSLGRLGAYLAVPVWRLVISGGYEWHQIPGARFERGTFGIAGSFSKRLALGVALHGLSSPHPDLEGVIFSAGVFSELFPWLSLSAGIDGFNRPGLLGGEIRPDFVFGASVRPILGQPWLSLGSEVRIGAGAQRSYNVHFNRAVIDVSPYEGIHLQSAYTRLVDDVPAGARLGGDNLHQFWFGLSVAFSGLEASVATVGFTADGDGSGETQVRGEDAFSDTQLGLTVRLQPAESVARLGGRLVEVGLSGDLRTSSGPLDPGSPIADVAWRLDQLADDDTVSTVLLSFGALDVGLGVLEELRAAVRRLRAAGKTVVADLANADEKAYIVAAACDHIRMDPVSSLVIDGFTVAMRYYADALSKVGVRVEAVEIGDHKTAPDAFTRSTPRPEDVAQRQAILDEAFATLTTALRVDRHLSQDRVDDILARGLLGAVEAKELGLVDELTSTTDPADVPPRLPAGEALGDAEVPSRRWGDLPVIAVLPIVGTIAMRSGDNLLPGATAEAASLVPELDSLTSDGDVAAVVLRVDSPGGDVLASDLIWRSVRRLAAVKPVIVSMGDTAASGGYWVSAPAHRIFAERNTVTGSIGIFAMRFEISGLFEKLGIGSVHPKRGEHADWDALENPASEEDRVRVRRNLEAYYETFLAKVATGRGRTVDEIRPLAEGKVYTGAAAREVGLVDEIGGLADAIREARRRAGLADDEVHIALPRHQLSATRVVKNLIGLAAAPQPSLGGSLADLWLQLLAKVEATNGRAMALLPYYYEVLR